MNRHYSQYYVPRSKAELLKSLLPLWKGKKTELREMSVKRLRAIFHRIRQSTITKLMGGDNGKTEEEKKIYDSENKERSQR